MSEELALLEVQNHIALLTMNRPDRMNALGPELAGALNGHLDRIEKDPEIRVVILTGAGRGFCAGGDVKTMGARNAARAKSGRLTLESLRDPMNRVSMRVGQMDKPVIGAINGAAAGWGLDLAAACDVRIASDQARFASSFVKRSYVPDGGGTWTLPRLIGVDQAMRLMLTGDFIDAEEALAIGLVTEVVPHDELIPRSRELATRIAANAPLAVQLTKRAVNEGATVNFRRAMDQVASYLTVLRMSQDHQEGVQSFLEKRSPNFIGD